MSTKRAAETLTRQRTLTFVTGNKCKLEEVMKIMGETCWDIVSSDIDLPELQGEPEDIAREKCKLAVAKVGGAVITEDTCLCFNSLNGLPGPYIKWFLEKLGHEGLNKILESFPDKTAYALCTFGFCSGPGEDVQLFQGRTDGEIVAARGPSNFGWDPIFLPKGCKLTYAEMDAPTKNSMSHRGKAIQSLCKHLSSTIESPAEKKSKS